MPDIYDKAIELANKHKLNSVQLHDIWNTCVSSTIECDGDIPEEDLEIIAKLFKEGTPDKQRLEINANGVDRYLRCGCVTQVAHYSSDGPRGWYIPESCAPEWFAIEAEIMQAADEGRIPNPVKPDYDVDPDKWERHCYPNECITLRDLPTFAYFQRKFEAARKAMGVGA